MTLPAADIERVRQTLVIYLGTETVPTPLLGEIATDVVRVLATKWIVWTPWISNGHRGRAYLYTWKSRMPIFHTLRSMAMIYDTEADARNAFEKTRWKVGGVERTIPIPKPADETVR